MRAAGPTARPAHALFQLRLHALDVLLSGFRFLHRDHPADPFIARERRNVLPRGPRRRVGNKRRAQIRRELVYDAAGDRFFAHQHAAERKTETGLPRLEPERARRGEQVRSFHVDAALHVKYSRFHCYRTAQLADGV